MRWLVALFVVLNIAYFLWGDYFSPVEQGAPQATVTNPANNIWVAKDGMACYTLGPYRTSEAAHFIHDEIKRHGQSVSLRAMDVLRSNEYEVYLGFYESQEEAEEVNYSLDRFEGFSHDVRAQPDKKTASGKLYYIRFDEPFVDRARAQRLLEYIRFIHFPAEMRKLDSPKQVYWLDYKEPSNVELDVLSWSIQVKGGLKAQKLTRQCPSEREEMLTEAAHNR